MPLRPIRGAGHPNVRTALLAHSLRFLARRVLLSSADMLATSPLVRWTWTGPTNENQMGALGEFRPTDRETVLEMMQGRFLLASKLVDTHGESPFDLDVEHADWTEELQTFSWLRHFRDGRGDAERRFARSLALDWIERDGQFNRQTWAPSLTARRVLNWLRHYNILVDGAPQAEQLAIARALSTQIASLRLRTMVADDPTDRLLVAAALVGVALCGDAPRAEIESRIAAMLRLVHQQFDADGLHLTRSARTQLQLMVELDTIRLALQRDFEQASLDLGAVTDRMHGALDAISLGTGEPGYFNGTGQLPHDIIVAVQAQSPTRARDTRATGGYGRLVAGETIVVADSGVVPPPQFAAAAHAGALSFEFSHGRDLIVGNCGPAPSGYEHGEVFRQGIAHSAPTIDSVSAAALHETGPFAGRLLQLGRDSELEVDPAETTIVMRGHGFAERFGVSIERQLSLLTDGKTLVGQDRLIRHRPRASGTLTVRFHLAPQTVVEPATDLVRLRLASGALWTFLWEGAEMTTEDSVRQSAYFGFHRTSQIVLEVPVPQAGEIHWIFTREEA